MNRRERLGLAGALAVSAGLGAHELFKPDAPTINPTEQAALDDTDAGTETTIRHIDTAVSLEDKITGADSDLTRLLEDGHNHYSVTVDGNDLHIYAEGLAGREVLKLTPDNNGWKVTCTDETGLPDWAAGAGIGLVEPSVSSGSDIERLIDSYDQLENWRSHWTELSADTDIFSDIGSGIPSTTKRMEELSKQHDLELDKFEDIIIHSDNPLVDHSE